MEIQGGHITIPDKDFTLVVELEIAQSVSDQNDIGVLVGSYDSRGCLLRIQRAEMNQNTGLFYVDVSNKDNRAAMLQAFVLDGKAWIPLADSKMLWKTEQDFFRRLA